MLTKNQISIYRKHTHIEEDVPADYCLYFTNSGYISIDSLRQYLDITSDFNFEMAFRVRVFNSGGISWLLNSCLDVNNNKIGIAVDGSNLYVQIDDGGGRPIELYISFSDTSSWHSISVTNDSRGFSASLDSHALSVNDTPVLSLPTNTGFKIASSTALSEGLYGYVDNILLTDTSTPIAHYPLITGAGTTAKDQVGHYDGTILNGSWQTR